MVAESLNAPPSEALAGGRPRPNVFRKEANFPVAVLGGVVGRVGVADRLPPLFNVGDVEGRLLSAGGVATFFLLAPKERRKDHSDSNWTASNSLESGV